MRKISIHPFPIKFNLCCPVQFILDLFIYICIHNTNIAHYSVTVLSPTSSIKNNDPKMRVIFITFYYMWYKYYFQNEALIGYSRVVCEALLNTNNKETNKFYKHNIIDMNAAIVACDCVIKYVGKKTASF